MADVNDPAVRVAMLGTSIAVLTAGIGKLLIDRMRERRRREEALRAAPPYVIAYGNPAARYRMGRGRRSRSDDTEDEAMALADGLKLPADMDYLMTGRGKCSSKPEVSEPVATTQPVMMSNPMRSSRLMTHEELAQPHRSMIGVVQKDAFGRKFMLVPNPDYETDPEKMKMYNEAYEAGDFSYVDKMSKDIRLFLDDDSSSGEESSSEEEAQPPPRPTHPPPRPAPRMSLRKGPPPPPPPPQDDEDDYSWVSKTRLAKTDPKFVKLVNSLHRR